MAFTIKNKCKKRDFRVLYGEKIYSLRRQKGMSQAELAEKLGVSRILISRWENDAVLPSPQNLAKLSDFFGVDGGYFAEASSSDVSDGEVERLKCEVAELRAALAKVAKESADKSVRLKNAVEQAERAEFERRKKLAVAVFAFLSLVFACFTVVIGVLVLPYANEGYYDVTQNFHASVVEFVVLAAITLILSAVTVCIAIIVRWREDDVQIS